MKIYKMFVMTALGFLVLVSSSFASHYGDTYGYSTKGLSLGGAMCARADDWSSVYYNVAGLGKTVHLKKGVNQIALQYQGNMPDFEIDIPRDDVHGDENLEAGTLILGLALDAYILMDLPAFISSARLGVGLCVNDDLTAMKINDLDPRTHNFMRYGREAQRLAVLTAFGMGFMDDKFGFGLGVNSSFDGEGTMFMEDIKLETEEQYPPGQTMMEMKIKPNLLLGAYFNLTDTIHLGASFRDESILDIYPIKSTGVTETGNIALLMTLAMTDYYQPRSYTLGAAFELGSAVLSLDVEFQEWSGFRHSTPTSVNFEDYLADFDDIVIPRVGLEYKVDSMLNLLFGYYYQPSFVPDEAVSGILNYLDNDKHVVSGGLTFDVTPFLPIKANTEFCFGYQLQYLVDRDVTKTSPTELNPDYSYGGLCHTVMLGLNISL